MIKRALISVSDKTGIIDFASELIKHDIEIISTGGTAKTLQKANIPVTPVADITDFPEIMQGRVKTLHPKIAGGILGKRDQHEAEAETHDIKWIDLVVCNLYPFAETINKPNIDLDTALENIDIGGPTMIRAAAKNFTWVGVIVDPADYEIIIAELPNLTEATRKNLAAKAFAHTAQYDALIAQYLNPELYPEQLTLALEKITPLRYGENPHQSACLYQFANSPSPLMQQHQGKELSYNNLMDADSAVACLHEFSEPTCVVVKHNNPCGVASNQDINMAYQNAWNADSKSAFGGIIALNRTCTAAIAEQIVKNYIEILLAPDYDSEALDILQQKPNVRVLEIPNTPDNSPKMRQIANGILLQDQDNHQLTDYKTVTKIKLTEPQLTDLLFAWKVVKHVKSNAIVIAADQTIISIGHGQVSRVEAIEIALNKANSKNAVLASDAFFPFRDSIDAIAKTNCKIKAIIQPGGSVRDQEVIDACDEHGIAMVFTDIRCFKH